MTASMRRPSRREMVLGSVAVAALFAARPVLGKEGLDDFMAFSRRLTGQEDLDPDLGAVYLQALQDRAGGAVPLDFEAEKKRILRQWFAGVIETPDGARAVAYEEALMWKAMGFEQPIGTCRGPLGYWSEPPAG